MAVSSRGFATQVEFKLSKLHVSRGLAPSRRKRMGFQRDRLAVLSRISCCCSDPVVPIRGATGSGKSKEKAEEWRFDHKKSPHRVRVHASPTMPFPSAQYVSLAAFTSISISLSMNVYAYRIFLYIGVYLYSYCSLKLNNGILNLFLYLCIFFLTKTVLSSLLI